MTARRTRLTLLAASGVLAAAGAVGLLASAGSAAATPGGSGRVSSAARPAAPAAGVAAGAASRAGAGSMSAASSTGLSAGLSACGNSSLAVSHTSVQGATGHGSFVLLFKNISPSTCTLYGYPGLDALNSSGHVLAHAKRTLNGFAGGAHAKATVTIKPGHFASATVEWMNFNPVTSGDCTFSASVATTPANTTRTVHFAVSVSICDLQMHPTVAGKSGNDGFAAAYADWQYGAIASSAQQGTYWASAESALAADGSEYAGEVAELQNLISLPDANQTPAQNAAYHHDIAALDQFFGTPGLYS